MYSKTKRFGAENPFLLRSEVLGKQYVNSTKHKQRLKKRFVLINEFIVFAREKHNSPVNRRNSAQERRLFSAAE